MAAETFLWVNLGILGIVLSVIYLSLRNHQFFSRKLARVRIRVDDNDRRHTPEPPEQDVDHQAGIDWLVIMGLLILLMLFIAIK